MQGDDGRPLTTHCGHSRDSGFAQKWGVGRVLAGAQWRDCSATKLRSEVHLLWTTVSNGG